MDTILHIGAGTGRELQQHLSKHPSRLLLIEPDPDQAAKLRQLTQGELAVDVQQAAVAQTTDAAELHVYNFREVNSLREPTGLRTLYPGLRETKSLAVEAVSIHQVVTSLALTPEQQNHLVIDAPGEEGSLVQALIDGHQLDLFHSLALRCSREPLYAGSEGADAILKRLEDQGYRRQDCDESQDADWPCWTLERDEARVENRRIKERFTQREAALREELKVAKAEAEQQAKLVHEREQQLEQQQQAYSALQRDHAIALRMQSLRESDLKELQKRHATVVEQKEKQAALLRQLTERLTAASTHLQELYSESKDPEGHGALLAKPDAGQVQDQVPSTASGQAPDASARTSARHKRRNNR